MEALPRVLDSEHLCVRVRSSQTSNSLRDYLRVQTVAFEAKVNALTAPNENTEFAKFAFTGTQAA